MCVLHRLAHSRGCYDELPNQELARDLESSDKPNLHNPRLPITNL